MFHVIEVALDERAVVLKSGLPSEALGPGRHRRWGFNLAVRRFRVDGLMFKAPAEVRAVVPNDWFDEVRLGKRERAIIWRDGMPERFLRPGVHRFWTVDPTVALTVMSVDEAMPELTDELTAVIPADEYVDVQIEEHEVALRYVQGRLLDTVGPGRYTAWSHPGSQLRIVAVDMRQKELQLSGQDLVTRDKVSLRLSLSVEYAVSDAAVAAQRVTEVRDSVYLLVQLAARDYVAGVTLDQLLEGRDEMTAYLEQATRDKAAAFGVRLERVGVKDVILPGDMKLLFNRVIEAEKEAAANVILRREETAATRSLANTAKVMADNPVLLRLKELEALKDIAGRIGEVRLVMGSDKLDQLLPAGLLGARVDRD